MNIKLSFGLSVLGENQYYFYLDCISSKETIWFIVNLFPRKNIENLRVYVGYPP